MRIQDPSRPQAPEVAVTSSAALLVEKVLKITHPPSRVAGLCARASELAFTVVALCPSLSSFVLR